MGIFGNRGARRLVGAIAAGALAFGLAACGGGTSPGAPTDAPTVSADGTDDGAKLTLWTRAPLEKQAKALVEAYNASHTNQVELTVVPNDDYVAKVGAAAGSNGLPDLFAADIVYVPNWVQQGLFQDISAGLPGAGRRFFALQSLPVEQNLTNLLWRADIKLFAGKLKNPGFYLADFAVKVNAELLQSLSVYHNSAFFHRIKRL